MRYRTCGELQINIDLNGRLADKLHLCFAAGKNSVSFHYFERQTSSLLVRKSASGLGPVYVPY